MTVTTNASADLVFQVFNEIGIIDALASTELTRFAAPELNPTEFGVLNHLDRLGDGKTPSWLAKAFQMTRPSMTSVVAKLERKGFVRVEAGETDRRQKFVYITDGGRSARRTVLVRLQPRLADVAGTFGMQRLREILPVLMEFRAYLDEERNVRDGLA